MGQEHPPTEQETGASVPLPPLDDIAGMPSSRHGVGMPPENIVEHVSRDAGSVPREGGGRTPTAAMGLQALRSVATALPGAEILRLWAYHPPERSEPARFTTVSAIHKDQNFWQALAPHSSLLAAEQQVLSTLAESIARESSTHPIASVLHFPQLMLIVCRNEQGDVRGVLATQPDPAPGGHTAEEIPAFASDLIAALALAALELELTVSETERRLEEVAAEEARARDTFISFAAHELRGPLTSIKGFAQLLARQARKYPLPDTMLRSVHSVDQQSTRMSEMLGEMLDASRILHGQLEVLPATVDLAALINKTVERRQPFFPSHNLLVQGTESPLIGFWDARRVEQILRDLVDNAARHSPNSTDILVELSEDRDQATVRVRDQGIGVAEADWEYIFEYLSRTPESERRNLSGLGLGLFVSRYLAESQGGHLWLEASSAVPPSGSTFAFSLPL